MKLIYYLDIITITIMSIIELIIYDIIIIALGIKHYFGTNALILFAIYLLILTLIFIIVFCKIVRTIFYHVKRMLMQNPTF